MGGLRQGAIRLFRLANVDVFLHWSWFLVAAYEISDRAGAYSSLGWNVAEYLALFLIVLTHEFGHALACRQVGGTANQIVLWPFGGAAFVNPPPRPGALLWSVAAGPLVNVGLVPVLWAAAAFSQSPSVPMVPNLTEFLHTLEIINLGLLFFNILPIYPMDGGKILWSLLWFWLGRARSLMVASVIGFIGVAGLIALAVAEQSIWLGAICVFFAMQCWSGFQAARALGQRAKAPRHLEFVCPSCKASPLAGNYWLCNLCGHPFDPFATQAVCPHCQKHFGVTTCLDCGRANPVSAWATHDLVAPVAAGRFDNPAPL